MLHYILVKYSPAANDRSALEREIRALFAAAPSIPGVHGVSVHPAAIRAENRHDLMIVINMEQAALPSFDASSIHSRWKAEFGRYIAHKTIFDCDTPSSGSLA